MSSAETSDVPSPTEPEVSFVMPCLNEAETLERCVRAARDCAEANGWAAEVVVADNGSSDGSQEIARRAGARVVPIALRGYGNALRGGIEAARGRYVVMGDADLSYDFGEAPRFIERLRAGAELVMGTRFGLGKIDPGAMPWKHRWLGNPVLSWLGRTLFGAPVRDFHCGLRAFSREAYRRLDLHTTGMEFASEMVIKAVLQRQVVTEVPITLHRDGRNRPPHLRSFRDGWRHLRFMLCMAPRWTLLWPGVACMLVGAILGIPLAFGTWQVGSVALDINTLAAASALVLVGYQWITAFVAIRLFGLTSEIGPPSQALERAFRTFRLELGLIVGALLCLSGLGLIGWLLRHWAASGFGPMDPQASIRPTIAGVTLLALGAQTILMSLVYSMFGLQRDGSLERR